MLLSIRFVCYKHFGVRPRRFQISDREFQDIHDVERVLRDIEPRVLCSCRFAFVMLASSGDVGIFVQVPDCITIQRPSFIFFAQVGIWRLSGVVDVSGSALGSWLSAMAVPTQVSEAVLMKSEVFLCRAELLPESLLRRVLHHLEWTSNMVGCRRVLLLLEIRFP